MYDISVLECIGVSIISVWYPDLYRAVISIEQLASAGFYRFIG